MFQFLTHVELSRSMAAILEMPQYVAYQKNVAFAFMKLSAKSHSFNILFIYLFIYLYHSALRPGTAQYCKSNKLKGGQKQQNSTNK